MLTQKRKAVGREEKEGGNLPAGTAGMLYSAEIIFLYH